MKLTQSTAILRYLARKHGLGKWMSMQADLFSTALFDNQATGYTIWHISVPVPNQDKLEGLRQEGHFTSVKMRGLMEVDC